MAKRKPIKPEDASYWANRKPNDKRKDWRTGGSWIDEYVSSKHHPHRDLLVETVGWQEPFETILEVGCSTGPNIARIRDRFVYLNDYNLAGIDLNRDSIERAAKELPGVRWGVGDVTDLAGIGDKTYDIVILDACLMYVGPDNIKKAIAEINRVVRKAVIIVDWYNQTSISGVIRSHHWARNYEKIFRNLKFKVKKIKLKRSDWPSDNWVQNGYVFICTKKK